MKKSGVSDVVVDAIIRLCGSALSGVEVAGLPFPCDDEKTWMKLVDMASIHGVLPLVFKGISLLSPDQQPPRDVLRKAYGMQVNTARKYSQRLSIMKRLAGLFSEHGIDILFLKGATVSRYYPEADMRPFSDIDFYLFGAADAGEKVMMDKGISIKGYFHHHNKATIDGVLLEHHYDFVERINHKCNLLIDDEMKRLASDKESLPRFSFGADGPDNAYMMSPTMNAVFLMRHMSGHFVGETIPMRMLYDWSLFLAKDGDKVDWDYVYGMYDRTGMKLFASVINRLVADRLGCCSDGGLMCDDEALCQRVWESIIESVKREKGDEKGMSGLVKDVRIFLDNAWKHSVVYPGESYLGLFFRYALSHLKSIFG